MNFPNNPMKSSILPGKKGPTQRERDVQTILPITKKPQQVKDHEGKKR